jgi:hypothetical protein
MRRRTAAPRAGRERSDLRTGCRCRMCPG